MPIRFTRRSVALLAVFATTVLAFPLDAQQPPPTATATTSQAPGTKRVLSLEDLLSWKSIRSPQFSNDGRWMAYILAPNEGDAEAVVRATTAGATETRLAIGEPPTGAAGASAVAISGTTAGRRS